MPFSQPLKYRGRENALASQYGQMRNALTAQQLDPNSIENQMRKAQLQKLQRDSQARTRFGIQPPSMNNATAESLGIYSRSGDPSDLVRPKKPSKVVEVNTGVSVDFYLTSPDTEPKLLKSVPIDAYNAARNKQLGTISGKQGGTPATPEAIPQKVTPAPSAAQQAAEVVTAQETAKQQVEQRSPANQAKLEEQIAEDIDAMRLVDDLLATDKNGKVRIGLAYGKENVLAPGVAKPQSWIDAEAERDRLVSMLQLASVGKLKGTGPITENEQKILANAASVLKNPLISSELAEKEARRVRAIFAAAAKRRGNQLTGAPTAPNQTINWSDM